MKTMFKNNIKWIVGFLCLIAFVALAENVFNREIMQIDIMGYQIMDRYFISETTIPIAKVITQLGGAFFLVALGIVLTIMIKNKKVGLAIWINLIIVTVINFLLKYILQRPRPTGYRIVEESGYSFPSGHSMISMAFYGFLIYLIYMNIENKKVKYGLIGLLSITIIGIGMSRIFLGVHYTSDVLAGFLISIAYVIVYANIVKKYLFKGKEQNNEFETETKNKSKNEEIS